MKTIRYAFVRSLPIMAGYIVLGLGFGVLLQSKGYGAGWALVMSGLIYAGSMQYVAIDLLAGGASLISAAIMTLMVNARHLFYGISMLERYKDTGAAKPYLIFALTDETYSVVCSGGVPEGVDRKKYYFWVSLLNQLYWIAGGVTGALLGSVLPFDTTGIDFSMTALFLVVMTEQWKASRDHTPRAGGAGGVAGLSAGFRQQRFPDPVHGGHHGSLDGAARFYAEKGGRPCRLMYTVRCLWPLWRA